MLKKLMRAITAFLPVDKRRTGACIGCGACCKLPYTCPFLSHDASGEARCTIYRFRPPSCRKYPRTEREWLTRATCGFSFNNGHAAPGDAPQAPAPAAAAPAAEPVKHVP